MVKLLPLSVSFLVCKMPLIELVWKLNEVMCTSLALCQAHSKISALSYCWYYKCCQQRAQYTYKSRALKHPKGPIPSKRAQRNITLQGKTISSWRKNFCGSEQRVWMLGQRKESSQKPEQDLETTETKNGNTGAWEGQGPQLQNLNSPRASRLGRTAWESPQLIPNVPCGGTRKGWGRWAHHNNC